MKKVLVGVLFLVLLSSAGFAKDILEKFSANGNTYEIYVGYAKGVYVTYAGNTDTKYEKGVVEVTANGNDMGVVSHTLV